MSLVARLLLCAFPVSPRPVRLRCGVAALRSPRLSPRRPCRHLAPACPAPTAVPPRPHRGLRASPHPAAAPTVHHSLRRGKPTLTALPSPQAAPAPRRAHPPTWSGATPATPDPPRTPTDVERRRPRPTPQLASVGVTSPTMSTPESQKELGVLRSEDFEAKRRRSAAIPPTPSAQPRRSAAIPPIPSARRKKNPRKPYSNPRLGTLDD